VFDVAAYPFPADPAFAWDATGYTQVAQVCDLLYRRFVIGTARKAPVALELPLAQQVENLQYGRPKVAGLRYSASVKASSARDRVKAFLKWQPSA
jgi:hypothetical protein